jgi:2TM domain
MADLFDRGQQTLGNESSSPTPSGEARQMAFKRVQRKRKVIGDAVAYVAINAFLVVVWAVTDRGYFWPGWVLGGWGLLLLLDVWNAYYRKSITDADIDRELRSQR